MIVQAKELIRKNMEDVFKGFACFKRKEKRVKVSFVEFCEEGDAENLVTNLDLADNNKRAFDELEKHLDEIDLLKGMIDYQYYEVTRPFQVKLFLIFFIFYYVPLL